MSFQVGDKVIHSAFGMGEIACTEEKTIHGQLTNCYAVLISDLVIWVPIDDLQQHSLRLPTPPEEFEKMSDILTNPGEGLLEDRVLRKNQLLTQMRDGQLASVCRVVRDLTYFKRNKKLNEQEKYILERATNSLLTEWTYSLGISLIQAQQTMVTLLGE